MATKVASLYAELRVEDHLTPGLKKAEQGLDNVSSKATQTGMSLQGLATKAGVVATAIVGAGVALDKLATQGIAIEQSAFAFERLAGGAKNAESWIQAIQAASRGSVTEFQATNQAIQLMTMGLADSAESAGRFMEVAAITAAINPELGSIENAITNIGLTLANDSWMRLDQLGVDASKAKERIEELKLEGMAMTDAFDVAIMEQLEENAQMIGTEVLEIGRNTKEMHKNFNEAKDSASKFAAIVMEEISPSLSEAATAAGLIFETLAKLASGEWSIDIVLNAIGDEIMGALTPGGAGATDVALQRGHMYSPGGFGTPRYLAGDMGRPIYGDDWQPYRPGNVASAGGATRYFEELNRQFGPTNASVGGIFESGEAKLITMQYYEALGQYYSGLTQIASTQAQRELMGQIGLGAMLPGKGPLAGAAPPSMPMVGGTLAPPPGGSMFTPQGSAPTLPVGLAGGAGGSLQAMGEMHAFKALEDLWFGSGPTSFQTIPGGIKDTVDATRFMAENSLEFNRNILAAAGEAAKFGSLAEKFNISADRFDTDVFKAMQEALRDVEIEGTAAADAMLLYQLQTGLATGSSEAFAGQMDLLAQRLADGSLSAEDYVAKVTELSRMDLSIFDNVVGELVDQGDMDTLETILGLMDQVDMGKVTEATEKVGGAMANLFGGLMGTDEAGALEAASPLQPFIDDAVVLEENLANTMDPMIADIDTAKQRLTDMTNTTYEVPVVLSISDDPQTSSVVWAMVQNEAARQGFTFTSATTNSPPP